MVGIKNILVVIAPEKYNEEEFFGIKNKLEKAQIKVTVANSTGKPSLSKNGKLAEVQTSIKNIDDICEYDGIIFIGGSGARLYFEDSDVHKLVRKFFKARKIIGAICIAPTILLKAGILQNKKVTAYVTEKEKIERVATYTGKDVEKDGNIITGKWPSAVPEFTKKIIESLERPY